MKVLLAPLFFHSRACKHCARIFLRDNPGSWLGIYEFESLPPLGSFDTKRGFIPDFPVLLMFDEFVLDGEALELLKHPGDRFWLKEWTDLVDALESEGALTVVDIGAAAKANSHERGWMLRRDLVEPRRWGQAMAYHDAVIGRAQELLGNHPREAQELAWEFDPDAGFGVRGEDGESHNLSGILLDGGNAELKAHRDLYDVALSTLKSQLVEVNACITVCNELDVAPIMWAPYRRYLQEKLWPSSRQETLNLQTGGQQFFEVAFPAYTPTTVHDFARLRSDRRIVSLRAEVVRALKSGDLLDPRYPQRILTEVLSLEKNASRTRRIAAWIASAVGTVPIPGLGLAANAVSEAVTTRVEHKQREPWRWFYLISDGRGAT